MVFGEALSDVCFIPSATKFWFEHLICSFCLFSFIYRCIANRRNRLLLHMRTNKRSRGRRKDLKGNSHQIVLSEMSLSGVEVLIEKLLSKILGR